MGHTGERDEEGGRRREYLIGRNWASGELGKSQHTFTREEVPSRFSFSIYFLFFFSSSSSSPFRFHLSHFPNTVSVSFLFHSRPN